ncbi:MAG: hypothetical protein NDF55_07315 [archaeon GB-1867-005]|nr:hypothetical protein [Candidatus Culexmicrobium cathedralense]
MAKDSSKTMAVRLGDKKYYVCSIEEALKKKSGTRVCVKGRVKGKVIIEVRRAGWPFSWGSRHIEKDHYHVTKFYLENLQVIYEGIALLKDKDEVKVYGKVETEADLGRVYRVLYADRIELDDVIYSVG